MGHIRVCFGVMTVQYEVCRIFFRFIYPVSLKNQNIYFEINRAVESKSTFEDSSRFKFLLSPSVTDTSFDTRSIDLFFFRSIYPFFFQKPKHLFKLTALSKLLTVTVLGSCHVEIHLRRIRDAASVMIHMIMPSTQFCSGFDTTSIDFFSVYYPFSFRNENIY